MRDRDELIRRAFKIGVIMGAGGTVLFSTLLLKIDEHNYKPVELNYPVNNMVVYELRDKKNKFKHFIDIGRDRTLDEVIIVNFDFENGNVVSLKLGDEDFNRQNDIYKEKILPLYKNK